MTLHIGDVSVKIKGDDANVLLDKLDVAVREQYDFCVEISKKHAEDVKKLNELTNGLRDLFYKQLTSEYCIEKQLKEIDTEQLSSLLKEASSLFGFAK